MRQLIVNENDANQRVDKFLLKSLPTLPKSLMYKYIRNKKIKVNGKRCEISQRLNPGDIFTCYISDEFFNFNKDVSFLEVTPSLDILYEDENIIIMNKEVGLLCHSDESNSNDTLVNRMKHYLYNKGEYDYEKELSFTPALAHRIDRNTQGMVIGCKNAQALRDMNQSIREDCLEKKYLCIVEGKMEKESDIIYAYHHKEDKQVFISFSKKEGYKLIKTGYTCISYKDNLSVLEVTLYSGKSHQIRALFAAMKHPLYGDTRYGAKKRKYKYQALCAYSLTFKNMVGCLTYLNDQHFELKDIDFMKIIKKDY